MRTTIKARNKHAVAPIMRKGGVHGKSRGAQRAEARKDLRSSLAQHGY